MGDLLFTVSAFRCRGHGRLPPRWPHGVITLPRTLLDLRRADLEGVLLVAGEVYREASLVRLDTGLPSLFALSLVSRALLAYNVLTFFAPMAVKQAQAPALYCMRSAT